MNAFAEVEPVWVCEKGHVDDHHLTIANPDERCSRCGGKCEAFTVEKLAREYTERLRVNVGLLAENTQLKKKLREGGGDALVEPPVHATRRPVDGGGSGQGAGSAPLRSYDHSARLLSLPGRCGGEPIFDNGVRVTDPLDRLRAGDALEDVAEDFELDADELALVAAVAFTQHPSDGQEEIDCEYGCIPTLKHGACPIHGYGGVEEGADWEARRCCCSPGVTAVECPIHGGSI